MAVSRSRFRVLPLVLGLASGFACTAILAPRDDVQRCGSASDCEPTGDNRYFAECRVDPDSNVDTTEVEKICIATYRDIGCNPQPYETQNEHPLAELRDDLGFIEGHRDGCVADRDQPARRGCPPRDAGCAEGLVERTADGICDTEAAPAIPAFAISQVPDIEGEPVDSFLDTLDAFCQSFFCDETFVCDGTDFSCVKCDPDLPYGAGGCGRVFSAGAPSCVYAPNLTDVCAAEDADVDEPTFGDCE